MASTYTTKYKFRMLAGQDQCKPQDMDASGLEVQNHCPRSEQESGSHGGMGVAVISEF